MPKVIKIGSVDARSFSLSNSNPPEGNCAAIEPPLTGAAANCAPEGSSAQNSASESASPPAREPSTQQAARIASVKCCGRNWAAEEVQDYLNGCASPRWWEVKNPAGDSIREGPNPMEMKPSDCFLWMLAMRHLSKMALMTGAKLRKRSFEERKLKKF